MEQETLTQKELGVIYSALMREVFAYPTGSLAEEEVASVQFKVERIRRAMQRKASA